MVAERRRGVQESARGPIGDLRTTSSSVPHPSWKLVKLRIGKLDADIEEILAILPGRGFDRLDITDAHLIALTALPLYHRDPFDLLMAQSVAEGAHFVFQDQNVAHYGIPFVTCSDPVVS
ncbi:hypothetical protein GHK53_00855 [Sinorhizobium meliloti]|uniref:PIN domain-containing protein n=1 Tax=Rhizobium meliloti TaxID=382 RepID=A0AAW9TBD5_RHIML|nr:hypothetical protein [Sinorhizobium meliloti]